MTFKKFAWIVMLVVSTALIVGAVCIGIYAPSTENVGEAVGIMSTTGVAGFAVCVSILKQVWGIGQN